MKKLSLILALTLGITLFSCSEKSEEDQSNNTDDSSEVQYTEPTVPDEFVFPGEASEGGTAKVNGPEAEKSDAERVADASDWIFGMLDISDYSDPISGASNQNTVIYQLKSDTPKERKFPQSILLGKEKIALTLPCSTAELLQQGFMSIDPAAINTEVPSGESYTLTLFTPESNEIFGFEAVNSFDLPKKASELDISAVTLTSFNNFTLSENVTAESDLGAVFDAFGLPDLVLISSSSGECSVIADFYDTESDSIMSVLCDGASKSIIAAVIDAA